MFLSLLTPVGTDHKPTASYNASKAALAHWGNTLRVEMSPFECVTRAAERDKRIPAN